MKISAAPSDPARIGICARSFHRKPISAIRFEAGLLSVAGLRVATGKDFDEATGQIAKGKKVLLLNEQDARALQERLLKSEWRVTDTAEKSQIRRPPPPFTTSTLQQEANRKLRLTARDAMRIAQKLYEEGHITYMRTDSVHLSGEAIGAARNAIQARYGADYLSPSPRQYTTQSKGAQEAHEAIRPAGSSMLTADQLRLSGVEAGVVRHDLEADDGDANGRRPPDADFGHDRSG